MFRRTLLGFVAVLGLLAAGSGTAFANHHGFGGGHHHFGGGYGYGGYRMGGGYGGYGGYRAPIYGYGYRPMLIAPPVVVNPGYGYGGGCVNPGYGYGTYGYGAPFGGGMGYSSPGFGFYLGR